MSQDMSDNSDTNEPDGRESSSEDIETMVGLEPVSGADHAQVVAERDEYLDALRRLQADFENYRKRVQRDSDAAADRAGEKLVNRLLPVLDTFELAIVHQANPIAELISRPIVRVVSDARGNVIYPGELIDLAVRDASGERFARTIIKTENPDRYGIRISDYFA